MEATGKQLEDIAGRALAGQIGNGIAALQDPELAQASSAQAVCPLSEDACIQSHVVSADCMQMLAHTHTHTTSPIPTLVE